MGDSKAVGQDKVGKAFIQKHVLLVCSSLSLDHFEREGKMSLLPVYRRVQTLVQGSERLKKEADQDFALALSRSIRGLTSQRMLRLFVDGVLELAAESPGFTRCAVLYFLQNMSSVKPQDTWVASCHIAARLVRPLMDGMTMVKSFALIVKAVKLIAFSGIESRDPVLHNRCLHGAMTVMRRLLVGSGGDIAGSAWLAIQSWHSQLKKVPKEKGLGALGPIVKDIQYRLQASQIVINRHYDLSHSWPISRPSKISRNIHRGIDALRTTQGLVADGAPPRTLLDPSWLVPQNTSGTPRRVSAKEAEVRNAVVEAIVRRIKALKLSERPPSRAWTDWSSWVRLAHDLYLWVDQGAVDINRLVAHMCEVFLPPNRVDNRVVWLVSQVLSSSRVKHTIDRDLQVNQGTFIRNLESFFSWSNDKTSGKYLQSPDVNERMLFNCDYAKYALMSRVKTLPSARNFKFSNSGVYDLKKFNDTMMKLWAQSYQHYHSEMYAQSFGFVSIFSSTFIANNLAKCVLNSARAQGARPPVLAPGNDSMTVTLGRSLSPAVMWSLTPSSQLLLVDHLLTAIKNILRQSDRAPSLAVVETTRISIAEGGLYSAEKFVDFFGRVNSGPMTGALHYMTTELMSLPLFRACARWGQLERIFRYLKASPPKSTTPQLRISWEHAALQLALRLTQPPPGDGAKGESKSMGMFADRAIIMSMARALRLPRTINRQRFETSRGHKHLGLSEGCLKAEKLMQWYRSLPHASRPWPVNTLLFFPDSVRAHLRTATPSAYDRWSDAERSAQIDWVQQAIGAHGGGDTAAAMRAVQGESSGSCSADLTALLPGLAVLWIANECHEERAVPVNLSCARAAAQSMPPCDRQLSTAKAVDAILEFSGQDPARHSTLAVRFLKQMFVENVMPLEHIVLALADRMDHPETVVMLRALLLDKQDAHGFTARRNLLVKLKKRQSNKGGGGDGSRSYGLLFKDLCSYHDQVQEIPTVFSPNGMKQLEKVPIFYSNVCARMVPVFDILLGRILEHSSHDVDPSADADRLSSATSACKALLVDILRLVQPLYQLYHATPAQFVAELLLYYDGCSALRSDAVRAGLWRLAAHAMPTGNDNPQWVECFGALTASASRFRASAEMSSKTEQMSTRTTHPTPAPVTRSLPYLPGLGGLGSPTRPISPIGDSDWVTSLFSDDSKANAAPVVNETLPTKPGKAVVDTATSTSDKKSLPFFPKRSEKQRQSAVYSLAKAIGALLPRPDDNDNPPLPGAALCSSQNIDLAKPPCARDSEFATELERARTFAQLELLTSSEGRDPAELLEDIITPLIFRDSVDARGDGSMAMHAVEGAGFIIAHLTEGFQTAFSRAVACLVIPDQVTDAKSPRVAPTTPVDMTLAEAVTHLRRKRSSSERPSTKPSVKRHRSTHGMTKCASKTEAKAPERPATVPPVVASKSVSVSENDEKMRHWRHELWKLYETSNIEPPSEAAQTSDAGSAQDTGRTASQASAHPRLPSLDEMFHSDFASPADQGLFFSPPPQVSPSWIRAALPKNSTPLGRFARMFESCLFWGPSAMHLEFCESVVARVGGRTRASNTSSLPTQWKTRAAMFVPAAKLIMTGFCHFKLRSGVAEVTLSALYGILLSIARVTPESEARNSLPCASFFLDLIAYVEAYDYKDVSKAVRRDLAKSFDLLPEEWVRARREDHPLATRLK